MYIVETILYTTKNKQISKENGPAANKARIDESLVAPKVASKAANEEKNDNDNCHSEEFITHLSRTMSSMTVIGKHIGTLITSEIMPHMPRDESKNNW